MIDRIKEIRQKIFKTQANMASCLGVSRQAINEYERGNNTIPTKALIVLQEQYNINVNYLLTGKGTLFLSDNDNININNTIISLQEKIKELEIENKILKELIKK